MTICLNCKEAFEMNDEELDRVAGGLISADDEAKWKVAFPHGCTVRAKHRSCNCCLGVFGEENREFRLIWGSYRTGYALHCIKCATPLRNSQNQTEWNCNPQDAFVRC